MSNFDPELEQVNPRFVEYGSRETLEFTRKACFRAEEQWEALHNSELVTCANTREIQDEHTSVWLRIMKAECDEWIKNGSIGPEELIFVLTSAACQLQEELCK